MEHIYTCIRLVCHLRRLFPDNVVYNIRSHLKLALDLNGYTNRELLEYIKKDNRYIQIDVNEYLRNKYGKNRCRLDLLKKYQIIHVIQRFNFNILLRRYPKKDDKKKLKNEK